ncbi:polysaccharide deacetylase family protein [Streptomyces sp. NPDC058122]|uniref:polysaccharide deacetylase family protein n=1 Tax=Streptomyces sp. NPDC058122 TaxID=3346349 RepID=UPI0036E5CE45
MFHAVRAGRRPGSARRRGPDGVRRIARGRHEIGDHAWRHAVPAEVSDAQIREELRRSARAVSPPSPVSPAVSRRRCSRPGAAPTTVCVVDAQQRFHPAMFRPHGKRPCPGQPGQGLSQSAGQALHLHFPAGSGASFLGPPTQSPTGATSAVQLKIDRSSAARRAPDLRKHAATSRSASSVSLRRPCGAGDSGAVCARSGGGREPLRGPRQLMY